MSDVKIYSKKFIKLNEYFYMTPEGDVLKYRKIVLYIIVKKWLHLITIKKKYFYIVMNINWIK